jgi:hypothetical protein
VTISCLINQISDLPPEQRRIPLATIAERTKLSIDGVEFLLMKALALHLIEGSIDQVGLLHDICNQASCNLLCWVAVLPCCSATNPLLPGYWGRCGASCYAALD